MSHPDDILNTAIREWEQEEFRRLVEVEKERLRERMRNLTEMTLWDRLLDLLPFTITLKNQQPESEHERH